MDIGRARRLNILGLVLADRLRVKVGDQLAERGFPDGGEHGKRHSSRATGTSWRSPSWTRAKAREIANAIVAVAADLSANGVRQEELDGAMNRRSSRPSETELTNGYWMTVLGRAQEKPEVLDWARNRLADFKAISKADIDTLAKDYLGEDKASRVTIHPYAAPASSPLLVSPTPPPPPDGLQPAARPSDPAEDERRVGPSEAEAVGERSVDRFATAAPAVKLRPSAAHAGSTLSRFMVGGMTPLSIASTAARAPSAPAAPSRCPVMDLTALTCSRSLDPANTAAIAAASSPSPLGVEVAWAET